MWSNYARDDLAEYRARYPRNSDRPELDRNVRFYRNQIPCRPENCLIDEIHCEWYAKYEWLERCHSYIQWLFPIREAGLNPQAQVLQKHEVETMKSDPDILERVLKSFDMMLDFYGFVRDPATNSITRAQAFEERFDNLNHSGHNYLRITRMLKFLGEMDLEPLKIEWLCAFEREIYETNALSNCRSSYEDYWCGTIFSDQLRAEVAARNKARPPPVYPRYGWGRTTSAAAAADAAPVMPFAATTSSDDFMLTPTNSTPATEVQPPAVDAQATTTNTEPSQGEAAAPTNDAPTADAPAADTTTSDTPAAATSATEESATTTAAADEANTQEGSQ